MADAGIDISFVALAADNPGVVFVGPNPVCFPTVINSYRVEFPAGILRDNCPAGKNGDILQHGLAPVTETRSFDRQDIKGSAHLVDHQRRQGFAVNVVGNDHQIFTYLDHILQEGQEIAH